MPVCYDRERCGSVEFDSAEAALGACRKRFKNLPERHLRSLEILVRQHYEG